MVIILEAGASSRRQVGAGENGGERVAIAAAEKIKKNADKNTWRDGRWKNATWDRGDRQVRWMVPDWS